jgi:hypothetical protein
MVNPILTADGQCRRASSYRRRRAGRDTHNCGQLDIGEASGTTTPGASLRLCCLVDV